MFGRAPPLQTILNSKVKYGATAKLYKKCYQSHLVQKLPNVNSTSIHPPTPASFCLVHYQTSATFRLLVHICLVHHWTSASFCHGYQPPSDHKLATHSANPLAFASKLAFSLLHSWMIATIHLPVCLQLEVDCPVLNATAVAHYVILRGGELLPWLFCWSTFI